MTAAIAAAAGTRAVAAPGDPGADGDLRPGAFAWAPRDDGTWSLVRVATVERSEAGGSGAATALAHLVREGDDRRPGATPPGPPSSQQPATVPLSSLQPANPPALAVSEDLSRLGVLNEPSVLEAVRARARHVYTRAGPVLLALNPFAEVPGLYDEGVGVGGGGEGSREREDGGGAAAGAGAGSSSPPGAAAPHIYGVVAEALQALRLTGRDQAILISGESGAGKTETAKHALRYLTRATAGGEGAGGGRGSGGAARPSPAASPSPFAGGRLLAPECAATRALATTPLLEAFGNARTALNHNSSRFGRLVALQLDSRLRVAGARLETCLLEKSRVASRAADERSFHAFYWLVEGVGDGERAAVGLPGRDEEAADGGERFGSAFFRYLRPGGVSADPGWIDAEGAGGVQERGSRGGGGGRPESAEASQAPAGDAGRAEDAVARLAELRASLSAAGFSTLETLDIFRVLVAVLWLGNVAFVPEERHEGEGGGSGGEGPGDEAEAGSEPGSPADPARARGGGRHRDGSAVAPGAPARALRRAAALLGVDGAALARALTGRTLRVARESIRVGLAPRAAADVRDGLGKALYASLFDHIVERINRTLRAPDLDGVEGGAADRPRAPSLSPSPSPSPAPAPSPSPAPSPAPASSPAPAPASRYCQLLMLDIYGFEVFRENSLEQLCINYANEALQQSFVRHLFAREQAEYEAEGVDWAHVAFEDNAETLELLEGALGVISLLDEECRFPKGTDRSFVDKLYRHAGGHPRLTGAAATGGGDPGAAKAAGGHPSFAVSHYAGRVDYTSRGLLDKNRDPIAAEAMEGIRAGSAPLAAQLAARACDEAGLWAGGDGPGGARASGLALAGEAPPSLAASEVGTPAPPTPTAGAARAAGPFGDLRASLGSLPSLASAPSGALSLTASWSGALPAGTPWGPADGPAGRAPGGPRGRAPRRAPPPTLASRFRAQLRSLRAKLDAAEPHFVRCIKPNDAQLPGAFDAPRVLDQLRCCGVMEVARIAKAGYPSRPLIEDLAARYGPYVRPAAARAAGGPSDAALGLLEAFDVGPSLYRLGRTRVFLRPGVLAAMERSAAAADAAALRLQSAWRARGPRLAFSRLRAAAVALQGAWRARELRLALARALAARVSAALRVQRCWRGTLGRREAASLRAAAECWAREERAKLAAAGASAGGPAAAPASGLGAPSPPPAEAETVRLLHLLGELEGESARLTARAAELEDENASLREANARLWREARGAPGSPGRPSADPGASPPGPSPALRARGGEPLGPLRPSRGATKDSLAGSAGILGTTADSDEDGASDGGIRALGGGSRAPPSLPSYVSPSTNPLFACHEGRPESGESASADSVSARAAPAAPRSAGPAPGRSPDLGPGARAGGEAASSPPRAAPPAGAADALAREMAARMAMLGDDAAFIREVAAGESLAPGMDPVAELERLRRRYRSWKSLFKARLAAAERELREQSARGRAEAKGPPSPDRRAPPSSAPGPRAPDVARASAASATSRPAGGPERASGRLLGRVLGIGKRDKAKA